MVRGSRKDETVACSATGVQSFRTRDLLAVKGRLSAWARSLSRTQCAQAGEVVVTLHAACGVGRQEATTRHRKLRWMRIHARVTGDAVLLAVAARALRNVAARHDPVVVCGGRLEPTGWVVLSQRRGCMRLAGDDVCSHMTARTEGLHGVALDAIAAVRPRIHGVNRDEVGRMNRERLGELRIVARGAVLLDVARHALLHARSRNRTVPLCEGRAVVVRSQWLDVNVLTASTQLAVVARRMTARARRRCARAVVTRVAALHRRHARLARRAVARRAGGRASEARNVTRMVEPQRGLRRGRHHRSRAHRAPLLGRRHRRWRTLTIADVARGALVRIRRSVILVVAIDTNTHGRTQRLARPAARQRCGMTGRARLVSVLCVRKAQRRRPRGIDGIVGLHLLRRMNRSVGKLGRHPGREQHGGEEDRGVGPDSPAESDECHSHSSDSNDAYALRLVP